MQTHLPLLLCCLLLSSGCKKPSAELSASPALPEVKSPPQASSSSVPVEKKSPPQVSIYFVPVSNAPTSELNDLPSYYEQKFNLKSVVLPQMAGSSRDFDPERHQLIAENVLHSLQQGYSSYLLNNSAILIGVTSDDMYPLGEDWRFCFGWRMPEIRMAVVSIARMNLHYPEEPTREANISTRLRKMITKDIGIMYYHMSPNNNPRSVLFSGILGIQELDQVTEDF